MATARIAANAARSIARSSHASTRSFASTSQKRAISEFAMPSMSPTMESGKISSWKVKEGDKFSAGDVLLTVETDKAEVDVEAQDDGVMGKIIFDEKESSITVGKTIALLAEEGDDISNLSVPESSSSSSASSSKEDSNSSSSSASSSISKESDSKPAAAQEKTSSPSSSPVKATDSTTSSSSSSSHEHYSHPRGLLPSVLRLLTEGGVKASDVESIPTTGRRGQLTKSDVLLYLGQVEEEGLEKYLKWSHAKMEIYQTPSDRSASSASSSSSGGKAPQKEEILSGDEFRRSILAGLAKRTKTPTIASQVKELKTYGFDDILDGYLPKKGLEAKVDPALVKAARANVGPKDAFSEILGL